MHPVCWADRFAVWQPDILKQAYESACENRGAAGKDRVRFETIEGLKEWLSGIGKLLRESTYRPGPAQRRASGGKLRGSR
jgi:hypothetical protein